MRKVINIQTVFAFSIGVIWCLLVLRSNKTVDKPVKKIIVHKHAKVQDWESEKNSKKIEYYDHLYNTPR